MFSGVVLAQTKDSTKQAESIFKNVEDAIKYYPKSRSHFTIDTTDSRFNKFLQDVLIVNQRQIGIVKDTTFDKYEGKIIKTINIINNKVFERYSKKRFEAWLQKFVNNTHTATHQNIIRNMLLFSEGERVNSQNFILSEHNISNNPYIHHSDILIMPDVDSRYVNVFVFTRDSWSWELGVYMRSEYDSHFEITENNFLGLGHSLGLRYIYNLDRDEAFTGMDLSYDIPNIKGSFWDMYSRFGYGGKDYHVVNLGAEKKFQKSGDYMAGIGVNEYRGEWKLTNHKTTEIVNHTDFGVWLGKSFKTNSLSTPYLSVSYSQSKFHDRPTVNYRYNPDFHNFNRLIGSFGIYSESFFRGNYIFNFDKTESIPYGYSIELKGGYEWGEFENKTYLGIKAGMGAMLKFGYLNLQSEYGTYLYNDYAENKIKTNRNIFKLSARYFSKLVEIQDFYDLRFFFNSEYITATNTGIGEGAFLNYRTLDGRLKGDMVLGTTRMLMRPEIVLFTPLEFVGFKVAFFTFSNLGTLGFSANPFANKFYSDIGVGVRIRNRNFILKNIEIKFIIGINNTPNYSNNIYYIGSQPKLRMEGFVPSIPNTINYNKIP